MFPDRPRYWRLIGQTAVPCDPQPGHETPEEVAALLRWAEDLDLSCRQVLRDELPGGCWVSTVFLGLDHGWHSPEPILFETAVFANGEIEIVSRCSTWLQAEEQHHKALALLEAAEAGRKAIATFKPKEESDA